MHIEATTVERPPANHTHTIITHEAFRHLIADIVGRRKAKPSVRMCAPYHYVEYLNSPVGLVVLAHHDDAAGQVDGIHPASIGKSIKTPRNIVERLKKLHANAPDYNTHYMNRRDQGALVLEAFGRMIDGGDSEAPFVKTDRRANLEFYNTQVGPIVGVIENPEEVYVILPLTVQVAA